MPSSLAQASGDPHGHKKKTREVTTTRVFQPTELSSCLLKGTRSRQRSRRIDPRRDAEEHHCGSVVGDRAEPKLNTTLRAEAGPGTPDCLGVLVGVIRRADQCRWGREAGLEG
jgi:hypothetical protein